MENRKSIIQIVGGFEFGKLKKDDDYQGYGRLLIEGEGHPEKILGLISSSILLVKFRINSKEPELKNKNLANRVPLNNMIQAIDGIINGHWLANEEATHEATIRIDEHSYVSPRLAHLGKDQNIEWVYILDCNRNLVNLYTSKQGIRGHRDELFSAPPLRHLECDFIVDPGRIFSKEFTQDKFITVMSNYANGIQAIESAGWLFNKKPDPYLLLAKRAAKASGFIPDIIVLPEKIKKPLREIVSVYCI